MEDIGVFILTGGLFLVLFFLKEKFKQAARKNQEPVEPFQEPHPPKVISKSFSSNPNMKLPARKQSFSYEVEKRKRAASFLQRSLKNKASLKQAFILSEVLKRVDEP